MSVLIGSTLSLHVAWVALAFSGQSDLLPDLWPIQSGSMRRVPMAWWAECVAKKATSEAQLKLKIIIIRWLPIQCTHTQWQGNVVKAPLLASLTVHISLDVYLHISIYIHLYLTAATFDSHWNAWNMHVLEAHTHISIKVQGSRETRAYSVRNLLKFVEIPGSKDHLQALCLCLVYAKFDSTNSLGSQDQIVQRSS